MNEKFLKMLEDGNVEEWNEWRENDPDAYQYVNLENIRLPIRILKGINLSSANLAQAHLYGIGMEESSLRFSNLYKANLQKATFNNSVLVGVNFEKADLSEAILKGTDLRGANLHNVNLRSADLSGSNVESVRYKKLGSCRGIKLDGCFGSPRFIRDAKDNEFIEEFYENNKILYWLWKISSDCGRSIWLWLFWSLLLAFWFGLSFFFLGPEHFLVKDLPFDLKTMLYYSVVTFTTLGFGDIVPITHTGAKWVVCEVATGYIMLGGLIAIFSTKLARRAS